jgi:large subunit ribosomal protein L23
MSFAEDIIIRPYITEKSNEDMANGKYTFIVDCRATKTAVKNAVEKLFGVKVLEVNTVNYDGKKKGWEYILERHQSGRRLSSK